MIMVISLTCCVSVLIYYYLDLDKNSSSLHIVISFHLTLILICLYYAQTDLREVQRGF